MKVISVNIGEPKEIIWEGKKYHTGIYKYPVEDSIFLGQTDVKDDHVIDRRYHGGIDKACYAFSADAYSHWESLYPNLNFLPGMFGENLTIQNLEEDKIHIGDTFTVGKAIIQVTEPRQPCIKLNIRFNSKTMIKEFIEHGRCGVYFRVIQSGNVKSGDRISKIENGIQPISVYEVFRLLYGIGEKEKALALLNNEELGNSVRPEIKRIWKL